MIANNAMKRNSSSSKPGIPSPVVALFFFLFVVGSSKSVVDSLVFSSPAGGGGGRGGGVGGKKSSSSRRIEHSVGVFGSGGQNHRKSVPVAPLSVAAVRNPPATDADVAGDGLSSLSVAELKRLLNDRGVDFRDCLEKRDLVERLKGSHPVSGGSSSDARPRRRRSFSSPFAQPPKPKNHITETERTVIDTFKRVSPCVANIQTTQILPRRSTLGLVMKGMEIPAGSGSGFLWDEKGHVVTNYHVVAAGGGGGGSANNGLPRRVKVKLQGSGLQGLDATVVGVDPEKDIAVLKIVDNDGISSSFHLPRPIDLGSSSDLEVGQSVLAIGNPFGLDDTLTTGVVSAIDREVDGVGGRVIKGCVQTDAAINPGNSGGPLLDSSGRLIGINTAIFSPGGGSAGNVGIGFAIPVDTVRRVVNQIIRHGRVVRPSIGINVYGDGILRSIENRIGRSLKGAMIEEVIPNGPAYDTGALKAASLNSDGSIELGDLIISVDDEPVAEIEDLLSAIEERGVGEKIELGIWKGCNPNKKEKVTVTLTNREKLLQLQEEQQNRKEQEPSIYNNNRRGSYFNLW